VGFGERGENWGGNRRAATPLTWGPGGKAVFSYFSSLIRRWVGTDLKLRESAERRSGGFIKDAHTM